MPDQRLEELEDLVALLPPLLGVLEAMADVARRFDPTDLGPATAALAGQNAVLAALAPRLEAWPDRLADVRDALKGASKAALAGLEGARAATRIGDIQTLYRALGQASRAQETLYALAPRLPPVSRFFLDPAVRLDAGLSAALESGPAPGSGVTHGQGEPGARGGWSGYAPEYYRPDRDWPLVVALHGGGGSGRSFLWSWLRDARSFGAILITPTAIGRTWALRGPDPDTPNLAAIVNKVRSRWRIDPGQILLAGMSDGGTFACATGLKAGSPFTHLAPACTAFRPLRAAMADPQRIRGLPIYLAHGTRDWMFPIARAREADVALKAAGARVTFREVADLGHAYPRELNPEILAWMGRTPPSRPHEK